MFLGSFRHAIDGKGRVAIPAPLRRGLPAGSVVAVGPEGRLVIHPPEEWERQVQRHQVTPETPADQRRYSRQLFASARDVELDAQGRILLDSQQREWAGLREKAVFIGLGTVVEIIGEERWENESADFDAAQFTSLHDSVNTRSGSAPAAPA